MQVRDEKSIDMWQQKGCISDMQKASYNLDRVSNSYGKQTIHVTEQSTEDEIDEDDFNVNFSFLKPCWDFMIGFWLTIKKDFVESDIQSA